MDIDIDSLQVAMKPKRFINPQFHNGRGGAAIAVHIKVNAAQDGILRISREGKVYIQLTAKNKSEIDANLVAFVAAFFSVKTHQVELLGNPASNERLVTITGLTTEDLQRKITAAAD
jgi:uncharacterized protein YggU (UPF0235/DUF167 family)